MGKNTVYKNVSVIVPIRNEEKYIGRLLDDLLQQDYPAENIEVLIMDGMSQDNTRDIVKSYSKKFPYIKLIDNSCQYVPQAMNKGIKSANGDIIVRMDAHSYYPPNYISSLVEKLIDLEADNVGGSIETLPACPSLACNAFSLVMSHPFGVGMSRFRTQTPTEPIEVDTVPFGCFKKTIFDKIGLYDEDLIRNQDDELNARLRNNGGKIFLIPDIKIKYHARDSFNKLMLMFFQYGLYKPLVNLKLGSVASVRQFIPLLFVLGLFIPIPFLFFFPNIIYFSVLILSLHAGVNLLISCSVSYKEKNIFLIPYLFAAFLLVHLSYGMGYLKGLIDFLILKKHKKKPLALDISH